MNIFLVEDEYWALAELVELFRIYEPEHRVFAFDTGEEALLAAENTHPHLVLTDINMPGMDGLELVDKLNRIDPSIKKIMISVHDQFEYARQGMKFGVVDFLVKPVAESILYQAVDQALEQLYKETKHTEEWLHSSLTQMLLTPEPPPQPRLLRFHQEACFMLLAAKEAEGERVPWRPDTDKLKSILRLPSDAEVVWLDLNEKEQVILLRAPRLPEEEAVKDVATAWSARQACLPAALHIAFTHKPAGTTLFDMLGRLKQHLEEQRLFGMPTMVSLKDRKPDADLLGAWDRVRALEAHYKKGELAKGEAVLQCLLNELRHQRLKQRQLQLFIGDMLFSLKFNRHHSRSGSVPIHELHEDPRLLQHIYSYDMLLPYLHRKLVDLYGAEDTKDGTPKELIPMLLRLIHHQYQAPLSLQQFAAQHHVSLGYLSRMFKAQTGLTFSDYVTEYRIRKAKDLLAGGMERLQEVSRLVGYEDPKYFSAQFKKIVGQTPMVYVKQMNNRKE
jgi:two-component system, response regulator YesN